MRKVKESEKQYLKQHRKATLWWQPNQRGGHKLCGHFEISLTNQLDRRALEELMAELDQQLHLARARSTKKRWRSA